MKRLLGLWFISVIGWMVLSACSPTDNLAQGGAEKPATAAPEITAEATEAASARLPQVVGEEGSLYPPQDLSLVSTTGRPQFLNSYADWCTTCQHNLPVVQAIAAQFAEQVDLINVNIDLTATQAVRDRFNITDRSQYILVDAAGNAIQKWYGFLDQAEITKAIQDYLGTLG